MKLAFMHLDGSILRVCGLALLLALPLGGPSLGQTANGDGAASEGAGEPDQAGETSEAPPSDGPFIEALSRLATVLGSMHFLRTLCATEDQSIWRDEMGRFIAAQKPGEADKRRLIASFNNGYRAYESTYRSCTDAARLAHNRYQSEGEKLAQDIVTRYGN
ncbi:MAG: TIGR02301 family protein [Fulvimarina manganoxydans]|uniref:TIGR02301 family protein n=1 Tax=Fulvimarina manganoxydans TaxID=937218 RepID=UPI002355B521|nr:TIGR02301 family protein [Fulvimarina manganoxydans]MCK5934102.1 TIGR02301 family protein [Fulvimarina manganoxydans]